MSITSPISDRYPSMDPSTTSFAAHFKVLIMRGEGFCEYRDELLDVYGWGETIQAAQESFLTLLGSEICEINKRDASTDFNSEEIARYEELQSFANEFNIDLRCYLCLDKEGRLEDLKPPPLFLP